MLVSKRPTGFAIAVLIGSLLLSSGCASIMGGASKGTPITSEPSGASVYVNGVEAGVTPLTIKGKDCLTLDVESPSFAPYRGLGSALKRTIKPIFFANVIFCGGLWFFLYDALSGNMYNYDYPFHVKLVPSAESDTPDPFEEFQRKHLTPPAGKALLVLIHIQWTLNLRTNETVYLDGEGIVLNGKVGYKTIVLSPGRHSLGVDTDASPDLMFDADSTSFYRLETQNTGEMEFTGTGTRTRFWKFLKKIPGEDAIRSVYTSHRLANR